MPDGGEYVHCFACDGTGEDELDPLGECAYCHGSGERLVFGDDEQLDDDDEQLDDVPG